MSQILLSNFELTSYLCCNNSRTEPCVFPETCRQACSILYSLLGVEQKSHLQKSFKSLNRKLFYCTKSHYSHLYWRISDQLLHFSNNRLACVTATRRILNTSHTLTFNFLYRSVIGPTIIQCSDTVGSALKRPSSLQLPPIIFKGSCLQDLVIP